MAYYKTEAPEVKKAWEEFQANAKKVHVAGNAFAEQFEGAKALFSNNWHSGCGFFGLCFSPVINSPIWTKPDWKLGKYQRPRSAVQAGIKGEERKALKVELEALQAKWKAGEPKEKASLDDFLASIGTHSGNLFFSAFKQFIGADGAFYFSTTVSLSNVVEILGSEFDAAEKAAEGK